MKILVPIDVVHEPAKALEQLQMLVPLKNASVHLLYVQEVLPSYERLLAAIGDFPQDLPRQIAEKADKELAQLADGLKKICSTVTTEIVSGPASLMIETVARDEKFDLIALAPGAHSRVARFFLGSTSQRVIKHCTQSVIVLRTPGGVVSGVKNIVAGVDGSPESLQALTWAANTFDLAKIGATVTLVNVVSIAPMFKFISPVTFVASVEDNLIMSGEAILAEAEKALSDRGVKNISVKLKNGDPTEELLQACKTAKADLLVVGAQGTSAVERLLIGSVSSRLAVHADCSTAVFKLPRTQV